MYKMIGHQHFSFLMRDIRHKPTVNFVLYVTVKDF